MKFRFLHLVNTLKLVAPFTLALTTAIASNTSAQAVQFKFTHDSDTPDYVIDGFNKAGNDWASNLPDEVNVNIRVHFGQSSNSKALGAARPNMVRIDYDKFLTNSFRDISSEDDLTAFKNLQIDSGNQGFTNILQALGVDIKNRESANIILKEKGFHVEANKTITEQAQDIFKQLTLEQLNTLDRNQIQFFDSHFSMVMNNDDKISYKKHEELESVNDNTLVDNNESFNNKKIWLSRANAKALDLLSANESTKFDAEIFIANNDIWDTSRVYNPNAEVDSNKFDLRSVIQHEIGHALGFLSGVDVLKLLYTMTSEDDTNQTDKKDKKNQSSHQILRENDLAYVSPMDLFRCSANSKDKGIFDWSLGSQTYFSIDSCQTNLGEFTDGYIYQISHWSENGEFPLGTMNPTLGLGKSLNISDLDLKLLNVIGWDIGRTSTNPSNLGSQIENTTTIILDSSSSDSTTSDSSSNNQLGKKNYKNIFKETAPDYDIHRFNRDYYSTSRGYYFWQEADYTQATEVPEPTMITGLGIIGLFGWLCRRRQ